MSELFEHQKIGVSWLKDRPHGALFDEPGLGKSAQMLLAMEEPALVVAPAMVLDSGVWDDEIAKWAPGADVTQVAYSSLAARNGNRIAKPVRARQEYAEPEWRTLIGDEAHYLKGRKTTWTEAFGRLSADKVMLATGTPIPNWAWEAFTLLQLLFPEEAKSGQRLGSYWRWAAEWFDVGPKRVGQKVIPFAVGDFRQDRTWEEFRRENWRDRMLLRLREDCLDLPPLTIQRWNVQMTPEQRRVYLALKRDFIAWIEGQTEVVAWNAGAQLVKLVKTATGLEALAEGHRGSGKLNALRTILQDRPRPTLVGAHFRSSVAACADVAREVGLEAGVVDGDVGRAGRKALIRSFQAGNLPVLCATFDTISEGMTLTAADQAIRVERSWRPSRNEQFIRRLHRIGQTRPVLCIDLVSAGTVDERVLALLAEKTDQQMRALGREDLEALV